MDSTNVTPNIKKARRLSLAYDFLEKTVTAMAKKYLSKSLKKVLEPSLRHCFLRPRPVRKMQSLRQYSNFAQKFMT